MQKFENEQKNDSVQVYITDEIYDFPGKSKSSVWKDFGFYRCSTGELDKSNAVCKICYALVKYCGNTTNLHTHLAKHRPKPVPAARSFYRPMYDEVIITNVEHDGFQHKEQSYKMPVTVTNGDNASMTQIPRKQIVDDTVTSPSFPAVQTILMNSNHGEALNMALAKYLISNFRQISTVENDAFINLLKTADPGYTVPSSQHILDSWFPNFYIETKTKIKDLIATSESVMLSTDVWSSDIAGDFISFNVHFIDDSWEKRMYNLCTVDVSDILDDGTNFSNTILSVCSEWGIQTMPILATKNDHRFQKACEILDSKNIVCLEDTIDHAARLVFTYENVSNVVTKCRALVTSMNGNESIKNYMADAIAQSTNKPLPLNKPDQWVTTYDMLQEVFDNRDTVISVVKHCQETELAIVDFSTLEFQCISDILDALKSLRTATKILGDQDASTASMILPILRKLQISLTCKTESQSPFISELKTRIWEVLSSPYQEGRIRNCLLVCSLLDPRYKDLLFVDTTERKSGKESLAEEATLLYRSSKEHGDTSSVSAVGAVKIKDEVTNGFLNSTKTGDDEPCAKKSKPSTDQDDWLADVISIFTPEKTRSSVEESVLAEIDWYLANDQTTTHPLIWWKNRQSLYPVLAPLAKRYLCATAMNEYHVGSFVEKQVWKQQRALLPKEQVNTMIFLNRNYLTT